MKSEVVGEMERLSQPLIEEIRSSWIVGLPVTLSPERAKQYARAIELMAQYIDIESAQQKLDRQFRVAICRLLVIVALFAACIWLAP